MKKLLIKSLLSLLVVPATFVLAEEAVEQTKQEAITAVQEEKPEIATSEQPKENDVISQVNPLQEAINTVKAGAPKESEQANPVINQEEELKKLQKLAIQQRVESTSTK